MKIQNRQVKILEILRAMQRIVTINELVDILGVSGITIRRDLQELEEKKAVIRTHGGCMLAGRLAMETEYHKRVAVNFELKRAIGKRAAKEINDGDIILIEEGTTCFHLSTHLSHFKSLSVYTNSLALISELSRMPNITLNLLGGVVDMDHYSVSGYITESMIEHIKFDKVFLEVDALDTSGICYENNESIARLAKIMLRQGKERILLCDHTKLGRNAYFSYASLDDFDKWITTPEINEEQLKLFRKKTDVILTE
ncbi:MAG: DeoR/GlpR transcriptional regulator [Chlorobi bacterium]|nr:DeoR/GlpR transcriptional regulator [Chlorobiota bacterium]